MICSAHQPNFMPYMGVIYKIYKADKFVLLDDVQYSNEGLHNCNFIKVNGRKFKISIPVKYSFGDKISQVRINYTDHWEKKLLKTVRESYSKAEHFEEGYDFLCDYISEAFEMLDVMNIRILMEATFRFGMNPDKILISSEDVPTELTKTDRLIYQCKALGCDTYYSGTGGREYQDEAEYARNGIKLEYMDYQPIVYRQCGKGEFIENLSMLDYIMNCGFKLPEEWRK